MGALDYVVTDDYYMRTSGIRTAEDDEVLSHAPKAVSVVEWLEIIQKLPEEEKKDFPEEPIPGLYKMTPEGLRTMIKASGRAANHFQAHAMTIMTAERAKEVRELRCEKRHSWRALAGECYDRWGGSWSPRTNQIMGIELCAVAAQTLNEDPRELPWNDL